MPIEKHDLLHELPEHKETIHRLKLEDNHFARLFDEYHDSDKQVHRIEENIETTSDEFATQQKAHRLALKDQLFQMILKSED
ncbi:MAG: YdcH family protein [Akkermansiaceae bacterium]